MLQIETLAAKRRGAKKTQMGAGRQSRLAVAGARPFEDHRHRPAAQRSANSDRRGLQSQNRLLIGPFHHARGLTGETNALAPELPER